MVNNKLWVFQSNRVLTTIEEQEILKIISHFLGSWNAHGADLDSELQILENKFIVIEVNESQERASGCSIDSLNQCMREIDAEYKLDLLNRLLVSYKNKDEGIKTVPIKVFKESIKNLELKEDVWVYNLSVSTTEEFNQKFKQPLKESWAKVYL